MIGFMLPSLQTQLLLASATLFAISTHLFHNQQWSDSNELQQPLMELHHFLPLTIPYPPPPLTGYERVWSPCFSSHFLQPQPNSCNKIHLLQQNPSYNMISSLHSLSLWMVSFYLFFCFVTYWWSCYFSILKEWQVIWLYYVC